jgi:murein hydrolase activator
MRWLAGPLILFTISLAEASPVNEGARLQVVKEQYLQAEQAERQLLGTLYSINQRMKEMSRKRDRLTDRKFATESDVRVLARNIAELENRMGSQRQGLGRRIRELYLLGGQTTLRTLFSAQSALDLDRRLRFLKRLSDRDYGLIKDYQKSLNTLVAKRKQLDGRVRHLVQLQNSLKNQESRLTKEQEQKGSLLAKLKSSRNQHLAEMGQLRRHLTSTEEVAFNTAFFEKRGQLPHPVQAPMAKNYGFIQDDDYRFRLAHKGLFFNTRASEPVRSVAPGSVAFAGELQGYGLSVILDHGDHYYTVYAQLLRLKVRRGQNLTSGAVVGEAGGRSPWFGSGLYFEVRHFSDAIDPQPWFKNKTEMKTSQL